MMNGGGDNEMLKRKLRDRLDEQLPELEALWKRTGSNWDVAHRLSKFYRESFKAYTLQEHTVAMVEALSDLLPERNLNRLFARIVDEGTGKDFVAGGDGPRVDEVRAIPEAYFHARMMVEVALCCGRDQEAAGEESIGSAARWSALHCLYDLY